MCVHVRDKRREKMNAWICAPAIDSVSVFFFEIDNVLVLFLRIYKAIMNKIDNRDFVTFALMNVKRSVRHRPKKGDRFKENREERPRKWGSAGHIDCCSQGRCHSTLVRRQ